MAGHSKWANIKHKKGRADAARGKLFSRLAKEMTVAARDGGGDPETNIALRPILQKAKDANMPNDNIERAIKKGTGELEGVSLEEYYYEGYSSSGVAILIQALTDNKNRSASEVRHAFTKHGASMADQGAVTRLYNRKGQIKVQADQTTEEELMDVVLEAGAEDMELQGDTYEILTDPSDYHHVAVALEKAAIPTTESEVTFIPLMTKQISDRNEAGSLLKFVDSLEDLEDVQNVYANFDIADEILDEIEGEEE